MRRNTLCIALAAILALTLVGCGGSVPEEPAPERPTVDIEFPSDKGNTVTVGLLSATVPSDWETKDDGDGGLYVYPEYTGMLYISEMDFPESSYDSDEVYGEIVKGMESNGAFDIDDKVHKIKVSSTDARRAMISGTIDSRDFKGWVEIIFCGDRGYIVMFLVLEEDFDTRSDEMLDVFDTITVDYTAPSPSSSNSSKGSSSDSSKSDSKPAPATPAPTADAPTVSQANALAQAESYLSFMPFSREGLIEQLEYEKYSHEDAVYAVDHCGADWNEQAVEKAKSYLDFTAFSYDGLVEQLEYEGFTHEEAVYGVDRCGADWYEQAELKAKEYLSFMSFSHDGLVDQLEYEGFTHDQAEHGATAAGL